MSEPSLRAFQFIEGGARYGAAVSICNIAEGMRNSDIDVEFGVFRGRPLGDMLREKAFAVHEIDANHRYDFRGIRQLVRLFRARKYDVVHTHLSRATVNGTIAAKLTRTPIVSTVHGMNRKFTYMFADHVMTVSEAAKRHLVAQGIPEAKVTAVYNCVRVEPFLDRPSRARAKAGFGFSPDSAVIGTVSRAHHQKGIAIAIEAVADMRKRGLDAKYLFIGDGPHLEEFKKTADALGLAEHIRFPGFQEDIVEALAAMDVFVFPTYREAFGISLLEAMASEVPIVASNVDGVPEVLAGGSGVLLDEHSASAFADAASNLLAHAEIRSQVVSRARERVGSVFSVERTAAAVERVYREVAPSADLLTARRQYRDAG